jgi:serine/threonine-protein kinase
MGVAYKALDPDIGREVAVKTIRFNLISAESQKEDLMHRFIREAQAAGKLVHPNIITVYDVEREKDLTYIVMQYVEGESLQKKMAAKVISLLSKGTTTVCRSSDSGSESDKKSDP